MKNKQTIKCDVTNCCHCNCSNKSCTLNEIKVSKKANDDDKKEAICDNFESKK